MNDEGRWSEAIYYQITFTCQWKNYKPIMLEKPEDIHLKYNSDKNYKQTFKFAGVIDPNIGEEVDVTLDKVLQSSSFIDYKTFFIKYSKLNETFEISQMTPEDIGKHTVQMKLRDQHEGISVYF